MFGQISQSPGHSSSILSACGAPHCEGGKWAKPCCEGSSRTSFFRQLATEILYPFQWRTFFVGRFWIHLVSGTVIANNTNVCSLRSGLFEGLDDSIGMLQSAEASVAKHAKRIQCSQCHQLTTFLRRWVQTRETNR